MELCELSSRDFSMYVVKPFSGFDSCEFAKLNGGKVDQVKFFLFQDSKKRFGLVAGLKKNRLLMPFSASFSCLSEISSNNKIIHYHDAVRCLIEWALKNDINEIDVSTPPLFYNESHITKYHNALLCNHFRMVSYDVNQYFAIKRNSNYLDELNSNERRNFKIAKKNGLSFIKTDDIKTVYDVIRINRKERGYPLWMSAEDIMKTSKIIKSDFFLVNDKAGNPIASAYVQSITKNIVNIVYWGNIRESDKLYPMNFMAYELFDFYSKKKGVEFVNIGISTEDGIPNFGLFDFKESIGCVNSAKLNFKWHS